MRKLLIVLIISITTLLSCNNSNINQPSSQVGNVSGLVFKGPFKIGASVLVAELDANLNQTGKIYSSTVTSENGSFDILGIQVAGPVEIIADGFFFDECTGGTSSERITLRAISNTIGTVNVSPLTAIEYGRFRKLVQSGTAPDIAKTISYSELMTALNFPRTQLRAEDVNLYSDDGYALLMLSSLIMQSRSIASAQDLITRIRVDFEDGSLSPDILNEMLLSAKRVSSARVKENLEMYLGTTVPDISPILFSFIRTNTPGGAVVGDANNLTKLSGGPYILVAGMGRYDGYLIDQGHTLSFVINASNTVARFYNSDGWTVSEDGLTAKITGPKYAYIDFSALHPATRPYDFTITVNIDGVETTVAYRIE